MPHFDKSCMCCTRQSATALPFVPCLGKGAQSSFTLRKLKEIQVLDFSSKFIVARSETRVPKEHFKPLFGSGALRFD